MCVPKRTFTSCHGLNLVAVYINLDGSRSYFKYERVKALAGI